MLLSDKDLLMEIVKRKLTTTFIGAVSDLEQIFGELWTAEDDPEGSAEWKEAYQEARKKILDRGNAQLRSFVEEMSNFEIKWIGPKMFIKDVRKR